MGPRIDQDMCGNLFATGILSPDREHVANRYTELTRLNYGRLSHAISLAVLFFQLWEIYQAQHALFLFRSNMHVITTLQAT